MARSNYLTTISIDTQHSAIHFYSMVGNDKNTITHSIRGFSGGKLDDRFFEKFKKAVKEFTDHTPSKSIRKVTVILPDSAILTDTVKIPTVKGNAQTQKMLDVTLGGLYRNYKDLHIVANMADQNKQYSTIAITAVQNKIVSSIFAACSENKLLVDTLTFASASTIASATMLNPKLKNASYLFLDIKDVYSRFSFVVNGKVMGYYILPFGLEFLRKNKVVQEDLLFDRSYANLALINAREKAKSKKLTVLDNEIILSEDQADEHDTLDDNDDIDYVESIASNRITPTSKTITKKASHSLPKFMLRETPETKEQIAYENFRVFIKWALNLIQANEKITELGKPQFVCVNLPGDLSYLVAMASEESGENGINFTLLQSAEAEEKIVGNLELYGGLYPNQIISTSKF